MILFAILLAAGPQSQDPSALLTGIEKTAHFEIRFRPGSRAEASVDRVAVRVEEDLAMILRELGLREFRFTVRLFLYDDVPELQKITGVPSGGHSGPLESHVAHDDDQTRCHELVHVVAEKFTESGPERRNLFFAEGLANAVLRFVHGVPVDAVAAFHRGRKELPTLAELAAVEDFYGWLRDHPRINAYDIGGSWFRFLLDTYGPAKTRMYYRGVAPKEAFGADLAAIEKAWHDRLDRVTLRPGLRTLLEDRADGPAAALRRGPEGRLDARIMGPEREWSAMDGAPIAGGDPAAWQMDPDNNRSLLVSGEKNQGDWCVARLGGESYGDAMVRCRAEVLDGTFGVQIQLGEKCQAMILRAQGTFLHNESAAIAHDPKTSLGDKPIDIVLRRRNGRASVWIDGLLAAEADVDGAPARLGVGCVGGRARILRIAVRPLPPEDR